MWVKESRTDGFSTRDLSIRTVEYVALAAAMLLICAVVAGVL